MSARTNFFNFFKRSDKEMSERFKSVDLLGKKIASCTEQLQLSEHNIVKAKVLEATQTVVIHRFYNRSM